MATAAKNIDTKAFSTMDPKVLKIKLSLCYYAKFILFQLYQQLQSHIFTCLPSCNKPIGPYYGGSC